MMAMSAKEIVTHADRMSGMEMRAKIGSAINVLIVDHIESSLPNSQREQVKTSWGEEQDAL